MSAENIEERLAKLEIKQRETSKFCALLLTRIHQLDKNMAHNLGLMAEAIKDPHGFDIEGFRQQLMRGGNEFDQIDAALADLDIPKKPSDPDQD